MSLYKSPLDSFSLVSEWACAKKFDTAHPQGYWAIVHGPTEASQTVTFPVELPAGAVIAKAWIGVTFTHSPKGGVKFQRINGETLPASGEFPITVTVYMTSFEAVFTFASYGTVESAQGEYSGSLGIGTPTLYVDYVDVEGGETEGDDTAVAVGNTSGMRLPRLLDSNLHEKDRLHCISLSLEINLDPLSTAEMKLPPAAPVVAVDDSSSFSAPTEALESFGCTGQMKTLDTARIVHCGTALSRWRMTLSLQETPSRPRWPRCSQVFWRCRQRLFGCWAIAKSRKIWKWCWSATIRRSFRPLPV